MSKFDYAIFFGGLDDCFVAHTKKHTPEETISLCLQESDARFDKEHARPFRLLRKPMVDDVKKRSVRFYVNVPFFCGYDGEGGCYTFCKHGERGSFEVWVIDYEHLR